MRIIIKLKLHNATKKRNGVKVMVNSRKISQRIKESNLTQGKIAEQMNMAQSTFSQKINNVRSMDLVEAERLQQILGIPDNEFTAYFFATEVA